MAKAGNLQHHQCRHDFESIVSTGKSRRNIFQTNAEARLNQQMKFRFVRCIENYKTTLSFTPIAKMSCLTIMTRRLLLLRNQMSLSTMMP